LSLPHRLFLKWNRRRLRHNNNNAKKCCTLQAVVGLAETDWVVGLVDSEDSVEGLVVVLAVADSVEAVAAEG
jgi:hypothetical protein